jgi:hypothetical protein
MRRAIGVLTLSFLCGATSVPRAATIATSIEVRCDRDSGCRDTFKGYVKKAIDESGTHTFVDDDASSNLHIVLVIAKNTEGDAIRGYGVAFVAIRSSDRKVVKLNNRYCKPDEVEAVVYREIREYVLK